MTDATNPFIDATLDLKTADIKRTDGTTITVAVPEGVTPDYFRKVVAGAFTAYLMIKQYPDLATVARYYSGDADLKMLAKVMSSPEYEEALNQRGIYKTSVASGISPEQSYCLEILTDPARKNQSMDYKLKQAGVTYTKYRSWLKNPLFSSVISRVSEDMIQEHQGDVMVALTHRAMTGDMRAIEYFNKLSGRFDPDKAQVTNLQAIVVGLIEIITKNVRDPNILNVVVTDIDKLLAKESGESLPILPAEVVEDEPEFQFGFEAK